MNFTDKDTPEKLLLNLKHGLKNTPAVDVQVDRLRDELLEEAVNFCRLMYHSYYGVYPRTQMTDTFDNKLISILAQCKSNSPVIEKIIDLRSSFVESLPVFLSMTNNKGIELYYVKTIKIFVTYHLHNIIPRHRVLGS